MQAVSRDARRFAGLGLLALIVPLDAAADNPGGLAEGILWGTAGALAGIVPLRLVTDHWLTEAGPRFRAIRIAIAAIAEPAVFCAVVLAWSAASFGGGPWVFAIALLGAGAARIAILRPVMAGPRVWLTSLAYPPLPIMGFLVAIALLDRLRSAAVKTAIFMVVEWSPVVAICGLAILAVLRLRRRRIRRQGS